MNRLKSTIFFMFFCVLGLQAQDLHFTQFYFAPIHTNPSQAGAFFGSYRLTGLYRSQYNFAGLKGYTTPSIGIDVPFRFALRKQDWTAIGVNVVQDQSGIGALTKGGIQIVGAYHFSLNKKQTQVISFGFQYGKFSLKVDPSLLRFEDGIRSGSASFDATAISTQAKGYTDLGAGVTFRSQLNKTSNINVGFAMKHINKPDYGLISAGGNSNLPTLITLHGMFNMDLTKQLSLSPGFIFNSIASQSEIGVQGLLGYKLDPNRDLTLNAGLGYRLGDAVQFFLGVQKGKMRVGASFDMTLSELKSTASKNGVELGVSYIGNIFKNPDVKQAILCPRY